MHFSAKEKEIIKYIDSGEIHDLPSYLAVMVPLKEEINTWGEFKSGSVVYPTGVAVRLIDDEDALAKELLTFMALCKKLERVYLLQTIDKSAPKDMPRDIHLREPIGGCPIKIINIFHHSMHFSIVPFNELTQFIENGYLTNDEISLMDERADRISGQETTIRSTKWTLGVSVAIAVMTAGFNYWANTNERNVSITNLDAIKSPISVSITEIPKQIEVTTKAAPKESGKKKLDLPR